MFIKVRQKRIFKWEHYIWINLDHIISIDYYHKKGEYSYTLTDINGKLYDVIDDADAKVILDYLNTHRFLQED